jgi:hypothetical protein
MTLHLEPGRYVLCARQGAGRTENLGVFERAEAVEAAANAHHHAQVGSPHKRVEWCNVGGGTPPDVASGSASSDWHYRAFSALGFGHAVKQTGLADSLIAPALTAAEWRSGYLTDDGRWVDLALHSADGRKTLWIGRDATPWEMVPKLIALANASLADSDARKITPEMVMTLREAADHFSERSEPGAHELDHLADILASYLPPDDLPALPQMERKP